MQCQAVIPGSECNFWGKQGCTFPESTCRVVVDSCTGCERVVDSTIGKVCSVYPAPERKWHEGICNFATHVKGQIVSKEIKIYPLKASKKASGKN
jgi:hypothetical protein